MPRKLGFWAVFGLVTGSQIGTSVFMSPTSLAPYGLLGQAGWVISGVGAMLLALVFSYLCHRFPRTGGPHAYVQEAFGSTAAFFTGWTYWVISWVSSTAVVTSAISYLTPFIGTYSAVEYLYLQCGLLLFITLLNLRGVQAAGRAEFLLTLLKLIPLFFLPVIALFYFDLNHFEYSAEVSHMGFNEILSQTALLTLWGFIGLECATTPADSVENPGKTIPRAVLLGTFSVAVLYLLNSLGIMGALPGHQLKMSTAAYADVTQVVLGGNWRFVLSGIAAIICVGTLNAWMLTSGQIALGLAKDGLLPSFFGKQNRYGAPLGSLGVSCFGIMGLLAFTLNENLSAQIFEVVEFSVITFLFVYLACVLAFFKILWQERKKAVFPLQKTLWHWFYGTGAFLFCVWVISATSLDKLVLASLFTLIGCPLYWMYQLNRKKN